MFALADTEEKLFSDLADLKAHLAHRKKQNYTVPRSNLSLSEDGVLRCDRFEGQLTRSGFMGLLNTYDIPQKFGENICPPDLLSTIVKRLSDGDDEPVRIQLIDNVVAAVMSSDRLPIGHEVLVNCLEDIGPIKEAVLGQSYLRITSLTKEHKELMEGDPYSFGWEVINSEDGWRSTEAQRYVLRLVCTNGQIGFDKTASFRRLPQTKEAIAESLEKLGNILTNMPEVQGLEKAVKWAARQRIGNEREAVVKYLSQRLAGDTTRLALEESITAEASWYDLLNNITSSARLHQLNMRRRYEFEGGTLLNWFNSQGHRRAPWRRMSCETCDYWPAD
jgi:hypothetical protein